MKFTNPAKGVLNTEEIYRSIINFIKNDPESDYKLIVGTDSHPGVEEVVFVTAIVIYRKGRGGKFYYHKEKLELDVNFKKRIFQEVARSLEVASNLTEGLIRDQNSIQNLDMEIHVDVGEKGPSSEIIKEVVGMVVGSGYEAMIKPDSYAASTVADRFTK